MGSDPSRMEGLKEISLPCDPSERSRLQAIHNILLGRDHQDTRDPVRKKGKGEDKDRDRDKDRDKDKDRDGDRDKDQDQHQPTPA